ncbi:MAG: malto-oligosyltrehalose trehalohydrolase, partial [Gammaproteobacteria bacterium]
PFGSEVLSDGSVRFRLWAPAAGRVQLRLENGEGETDLAMMQRQGGWYEVTTALASHGSLYTFVIDGRLQVPDPASRFQPRDVHGPSQVIDPVLWRWHDGDWTGRPWAEMVIYELHVGTFTGQGDFQGVISRLDYLRDLGVTAIELMPVSDFPGARNWGYDGVLPFAPDSRYGTPDDLKSLVQAAHGKGIMVFLDVVYNHFGPDGNYLHRYAPDFFTARHHTPWGMAVNYDGDNSRVVRDFFIHNALYWLEEYHMDGLRLDAVHAIIDDSKPDILEELAAAVRNGPGRRRHIHLLLENDNNDAHYLARTGEDGPLWYDAQLNDDLHHCLHVLITGETDGYYQDYADNPAWYLGRALADGFAYQGETSAYREGRLRGTPSGQLPPAAFVGFLQNHDQIGNRALGERITALAPVEAVRAATAVVLLAPGVPLLFMGEEWGAVQPFPYFCDFDRDLGRRVAEGRRSEFAHFPQFADPAGQARIPDPNAPETFARARLDWDKLVQDRLDLHSALLALRARVIVPLLEQITPGTARFRTLSKEALQVEWPLAMGAVLTLCANLADTPCAPAPPLTDEPFFFTPPDCRDGLRRGEWPPWLAAWTLAGC